MVFLFYLHIGFILYICFIMDKKEETKKELEELKNKKSVDENIKLKIDKKLKHIEKPLNK